MHTSIENLVDDLHQKEREIKYLKDQLKEKTGEEVYMPSDEILNKNLQDSKLEEGSIPNQKFLFFKDKVNSLNLPLASDKDAKNRIEKLRRKKDTQTLIQKLDLSYFAGKEITIELLKRVIEGLKILKSVVFLNLSHNDLTDAYIDVIIDFFIIPGLTKIDLSHNKLTSFSVKKLNAVIKNSKKMEYLDVSYNPFNLDEAACLSICSSVKGCEKLMHFGINDSSRDSALRLLSVRPLIQELYIEDSRYKKKTFDTLYRYLINKKYELSVLSLKFCKIDFLFGAQYLAKGLSKNKNLTKLNLYNTSITDIGGKIIIKAIKFHKSLINLDIGANFLAVESCMAIGELLKVNNIIQSINLSKNMLIINESFFYILQGLIENNTIRSFGDLNNTKIGVKYRESAEKILKINSKIGNWNETQTLKNQKLDFYDANVRADEFDIQAKEKLREMKRIEDVSKINRTYVTNKERRLMNKDMDDKNLNDLDIKGRNNDIKNLSSGLNNNADLNIANLNESLNLNEDRNKIVLQSQKLKEIMEYKKDINTIIQPLNPNKKNYNNFISYQRLTTTDMNNEDTINLNGPSNKPRSDKIIIPESVPGVNIIKSSLEAMQQNIENEKKKKGKKKE